MKFLVTFDRYLIKIMRMIVLGCFVLLLVLVSGIVLVRFVPVTSLAWSDEIVEWAFAWLVFIGTAILWHDHEHFRVEWLDHRFKGKKSGKVLDMVVEVLSMVFLIYMTYYGTKLAILAYERSPVLVLPKILWYFCIPFSGTCMLGYSMRNIVKRFIQLKKAFQREENTSGMVVNNTAK